MQRDQRVTDNWALLTAREEADWEQRPLWVCFCLVSDFLRANWNQYEFMLKGLREVAKELEYKNIPFFLLHGRPDEVLPNFIKEKNIGLVVTDFNPLKIKRLWENNLIQNTQVPIIQVDAHNIVPCWLASSKQEWGAYTFRPKITSLLPRFLTDFPQLKPMPRENMRETLKIQWDTIEKLIPAGLERFDVKYPVPGEKAAKKAMKTFLDNKLNNYHRFRNDPNLDGQSELSPYLHFGHLSPQRVAFEVSRSDSQPEAVEAFLEELIVRRELADNFCFYNTDYDNFNSFPKWAQESLLAHKSDPRQYLYDIKAFESANTHDPLWNACQRQMMKTGKMHGYLRMYWAKKILEWSSTVEAAIETAIYLNDKYELDGRDPNGYAGIAWSIGGVHDRPWRDRPIFGKIRYMSLSGCKRKFDVDKFISSW